MQTTKIRTAILFIIYCSTAFIAQDTLKINIRQADSIFVNKSFYLLAASMNIEAQKAQVVQAKLYPNPVFTADFNTYDPENRRVLHTDATGYKSFQYEQLILLGGKRKAEIELAKTNVTIAELEFQQLTSNLKYLLHSKLYSIGQQQYLLQKYNQQLTLLDSLLSAYQTQVDKGNIPLKEFVRLKGAYLKLNNDRAELFKEYFDAHTVLQKILQVSTVVQFEFSDTDIERYVKIVPLDELKSTAANHRPELLIIQQNQLLSEQYLTYQKKLAIPDINIFTKYDPNGGVFKNEWNTGIAIPIPLWNRNQGAIKTAQYKIQETEYQVQIIENEINAEIHNAHAYYVQTVLEYEKATNLYNQDFEVTIIGMTDNFQKRNVSIIEFIDFFEAYNTVLTELARIKTQLVTSAEELNHLTGKNIY